jgi:hypothetical protein
MELERERQSEMDYAERIARGVEFLEHGRAFPNDETFESEPIKDCDLSTHRLFFRSGKGGSLCGPVEAHMDLYDNLQPDERKIKKLVGAMLASKHEAMKYAEERRVKALERKRLWHLNRDQKKREREEWAHKSEMQRSIFTMFTAVARSRPGGRESRAHPPEFQPIELREMWEKYTQFMKNEISLREYVAYCDARVGTVKAEEIDAWLP